MFWSKEKRFNLEIKTNQKKRWILFYFVSIKQ